MTQKAAQKAAIVTGGAQNIGLAIAKLLAQRGYRRLNSGSEPEFVSTYVAAEFGL
jgi:NAD(P)-dependent dehydrogenase (short-subunit alcohol dehydrogenase family)